MLFRMFTLMVFFSGIYVGKVNGGWYGMLLCGVFGFFMAAIHETFSYLGSRCVYEIKQRDLKPAEKLLRFLSVITLPFFITILLATILTSVKLCDILFK